MEGRKLMGRIQWTQWILDYDQRVVQRIHVPRCCQQEVHAQETHEAHGTEARHASCMGPHVHGREVRTKT